MRSNPADLLTPFHSLDAQLLADDIFDALIQDLQRDPGNAARSCWQWDLVLAGARNRTVEILIHRLADFHRVPADFYSALEE